MKLIGKNLFFNEHEVLHSGNYEMPNAKDIIFEDGQSLQLKYDWGIIGSIEGNETMSNFVTKEQMNNALTTIINYFENKVNAVMKESSKIDINILSTLTTSNRPVTSVVLSNSQLNLNVGQTGTIKYTVTPNKAVNKGIVWISGDINVATVDYNGNVTAIAPGTTEILAIATDGTNSKLLDTLDDSEVLSMNRAKPPIYQEFIASGLADKVYATATVKVIE